MKHNFKKGDKIKCIDADYSSLNLGEIYIFDGDHSYAHDCITIVGYPYGYFKNRFVLVEEDTLESLVKKAEDIIKSGKMVSVDGFIKKPSSIEIHYKESIKISPLVSDDIKERGFSVAIRMECYSIAPVNLCEVITNIVEGVGSWTAIVNKDNVQVGCQTIPWEKIEEIIEVHNSL
jgi:hypothetical protein